jgi:DNA-binding transcriptional LysR family regulator
LEDSCGVKLYTKIGRGIELTRDGQSFQTDVGDILLRIDKLRQKFVDTEIRARASSLTIGVKRQLAHS